MNQKPYFSLNQYLHEKFGRKLYKAALSGSVTCPNRDGRVGTGGCIFCSASGSGDFASPIELPIDEQIERAKLRIRDKIDINSDEPFLIAYFQSFTATYAPIDYLARIFTQAIMHPHVAVLSVATRPDCLPDEVVNLLSDLNKIKPVWVELGLQTSNEKTVEKINRCYPLAVYDEAVKKLTNAGIEVVVHVILGLPEETKEDMLATVKYVADSGAKGIKLQLLHVLKGTALAETDYVPLTMEEYVDIVADCVCSLPEDMVVHRITGDGDKKILIAPEWSKNKKAVLNAINKEIQKRKK